MSLVKLKDEERFVVRGYAEEHVIDYNELLAHVERMDKLRLIIAFAGQRRMKLYKLDVKLTFLYGELKENAFHRTTKRL